MSRRLTGSLKRIGEVAKYSVTQMFAALPKVTNITNSDIVFPTSGAVWDFMQGNFLKGTDITNQNEQAITGNDEVVFYKKDGAWDLTDCVYENKSIDVSSEEINPIDVVFTSDGLTAFLLGNANDTIFQYYLTIPFNLKAMHYANKSFSVASQDITPISLAISSDDKSLFMLGIQHKNIYKYNMTTAGDLDTILYSGDSFDVTTQSNDPYGMFLKADGLKLFIACNSCDKIFQYGMTVKDDLTTISYSSKFLDVSGQDVTPIDVSLNTTGTKMMMLGLANKKVFQYTLSTPDDISTGTYDSKSFDYTTQDDNVWGFFFKPDGTTLFICGNQNDTLYQYDLGYGLAKCTIEKLADASRRANEIIRPFTGIPSNNSVNLSKLAHTYGNNKVIATDSNGKPETVDKDSLGGDFSDGGESEGVERTLGNTDDFSMGIITNGLLRLLADNNGNIGIGTANPLHNLCFGDTVSAIGLDTVDGSDNKTLWLTGGGAIGESRGASLAVNGNDVAGYPGDMNFWAGDNGNFCMLNGNLGLGGTNVAALLTLNHDDVGSPFQICDDAANVRVRYDSNYHMMLRDSSGNERVKLADDATSYFNGGGLVVGDTTLNASAMFEVESTTKGLLPPRMTTVQRNAISSPATGLVIYNTTTGQLETYNGAAWSGGGGGGGGGAWSVKESGTLSGVSEKVITGLTKTTKIIFSNIIGNGELEIRTSTDGGNSYDSGVSDYSYTAYGSKRTGTNDLVASGDEAHSSIKLYMNWNIEIVPSASAFELTIYDPSEVTTRTLMMWNIAQKTGGTTYIAQLTGAGARVATGDVDAIKIFASSITCSYVVLELN